MKIHVHFAEVAKDYAVRNKWPRQDDSAFNLAMTGKLGEIKREFQAHMQRKAYLMTACRNRRSPNFLNRI